MRYLLDTDTCSYLIRERPLHVLHTLSRRLAEGAALEISSISYSELRLGAERSLRPAYLHEKIDRLVLRLSGVLPWDTDCAEHHARLQAALLAQGTPIGSNDAMIAAHALAIGATLVSNNTLHFSRVQGLALQNWVG